MVLGRFNMRMKMFLRATRYFRMIEVRRHTSAVAA